MSAITRRHSALCDRLSAIGPTMPTDIDDSRRVAFDAALELAKQWYPRYKEPLAQNKLIGEADSVLDEIEAKIEIATGDSE